jgi:hypothetical protein
VRGADQSHQPRIAQRALLVSQLWLAVAAATLALPATAAVAGGATPVVATLAPTGIPVPRSFFGLSVEQNELPIYENTGILFDRFLAMLRPRDGSPFIVRLGGRSADDAYWNTPLPQHAPSWLFELNNSWLESASALVRRDRLSILLDLNLAAHSPTMAKEFASAVHNALPKGALVGVSVGDEPDLFNHQQALTIERTATSFPTPRNWPETYGPREYQSDYQKYAAALKTALPGVPLYGPDTASNASSMLQDVMQLRRFTPDVITEHRYPFSLCWKPSSSFYPTLPRLLGAGGGLAASLRPVFEIAALHGVPLRVTEMNSMSCGGQPGVANAFATALWAPNALFSLMRAGVIGLNWHIRPNLLNAPFHIGPEGIIPLPELYGLALFQEMLGPEAELFDVTTPPFDADQVQAWAVRSTYGLRVLLVNKGSRPADVHLQTGDPAGPQGRILVLRAPGPRADTGITLAGRWIGADARWHGQKKIVDVSETGGAYPVRLAAYSEAVVEF